MSIQINIIIYQRQKYLKYSYIWAEDRSNIIQAFVDSAPLTQEIKEKFMEYEDLIAEIKNLPSYHVVGPLYINMGRLNKFCYD